MRIAFLWFTLSPTRDRGPWRKVTSQLSYWSSVGHKVDLLVLGETPTVLPPNLNVRSQPIPQERLRLVGWWQRTWWFWDSLQTVSPDVVYIRFDKHSPALAAIADHWPTVAEFFGVPSVRTRSMTSGHLYRSITDGFFLRRCAGIVAKCPSDASAAAARFHVPIAVVGDPVALDAYEPAPNPDPRQVRLGFIGNPASDPRVQGLDHIIELANAEPTWAIEIIGPKCPPGLFAPPNVLFLGEMGKEQYLPHMRRWHAGLGPLGLYRTGRRDVSTLKVSEYLAMCIPAIVNCPETDLAGRNFVLTLPPRDDCVTANIHTIEMFVEAWRAKRVARDQVQFLDIRFRENARLAFIEQCREAWKGPSHPGTVHHA